MESRLLRVYRTSSVCDVVENDDSCSWHQGLVCCYQCINNKRLLHVRILPGWREMIAVTSDTAPNKQARTSF